MKFFRGDNKMSINDVSSLHMRYDSLITLEQIRNYYILSLT